MLHQKVEAQLSKCEKIQIYGVSSWSSTLPKLPGIYVVWNRDNKIVYVGETSNIQERMNDLKDTRHHTLRRAVGHMEFSKEPDFHKANSKVKFLPLIEKMVTEFFKINLSLTYCATKIGRKEFEEYLVKKYEPEYNSSLGRRHII
ncbi:GIY-YIG nuclease family protein [Paenibacillus sp. TC-CSREp1]|uniref:GIY-YIG nuclease family protein n=1 Tax=Paenibacillus sp. TC-CSREp1 TaxID=3410089 RepID=UPI003D08731F